MPRGHEFADQIRDINRHLWQFAPTVHAQWLDLWPALALEDGELNPALHATTACTSTTTATAPGSAS